MFGISAVTVVTTQRARRPSDDLKHVGFSYSEYQHAVTVDNLRITEPPLIFQDSTNCIHESTEMICLFVCLFVSLFIWTALLPSNTATLPEH